MFFMRNLGTNLKYAMIMMQYTVPGVVNAVHDLTLRGEHFK